MYKNLFAALFTTLAFQYSFGQLVQGVITDLRTTEPLPFVNIHVEGTPYGTTSNEEGKFTLDISNVPPQPVIIVSCIGYQTKRIVPKEHLNPMINIGLDEALIELEEVVISYLSAREILDNFHRNYTQNHNLMTTFSRAFYHSSLSENGKYKHYLEATINLREFMRKKDRSFEVEITQRRKSNDYRMERWGEKNNYLYDAIAGNPVYTRSEFLDPKQWKHYNIERLSNTSYDGHVVYVLAFTPKHTTSKPLYTAKVFIDADDFALVKASYSFINDRNQIKNQSLRDRTYHVPFITGSIQYQKKGSIYTPTYLTHTNGWTVINNVKNDTLSHDILRDEILITSTQFGSDAVLSNPLSRWGDVYKKPFPYKPDYWNNQITIPLSEPTKMAIRDLQKHQNIEIQYFNNSSSQLLTQTFENTKEGRIDSVLTVFHLAQLFNGVALVMDNGQTVLDKAYGYRDMETKALINTSSLFDIGSITKQFTTAIVLKLEENGFLSLEDKIGVYLPDYRYGNEITIHQLLAHRTGIPSFDYENDFTNASWFTSKTETKAFITEYASGDLVFQPDSRMEYSNSNFLLLTAIIEQITGKGFYQALQEMVLDPLDLSHILAPNALPQENVVKGYVLDQNNYTPEPNWEKANMKGVGCLYSTSGDLLKWLTIMNTDQLLSPKNIRLTKTPMSYYEYYDSDFGYSWAINRDLFATEKPTYFYGGTSLGFFSMVTSIPEDETYIILLNNSGDFPRIELTKAVLGVLLE